MEKAVKIEMKQRERIVDLLNQTKRRKQVELETSNESNEEGMMRELLKEEGGDKLLSQMDETRRKITELKETLTKQENQLEDMGFERNGSSYSLRWDAPDNLKEKYRQYISERDYVISTTLKMYDTAAAMVFTASTNEQLWQSVEGLI